MKVLKRILVVKSINKHGIGPNQKQQKNTLPTVGISSMFDVDDVGVTFMNWRDLVGVIIDVSQIAGLDTYDVIHTVIVRTMTEVTIWSGIVGNVVGKKRAVRSTTIAKDK